MVDDPLGGSRKRRDRLFIMAEILNVATEGVLKTQIMYRANLSFAQLNEYLSLLLKLNLLKVVKTPEKTIYKTTDKGLRYLQSYREIRELLKKEKGKGNNAKEADSLYLIKRGSQVICSKGPL
ncbi:MAG: winged helix-turn-helix domain-containing protein [Candidatus Bathyarchaeia archaeon]